MSLLLSTADRPTPEPPDTAEAVADRVAALDWGTLAADLDQRGHAVIPHLARSAECEALVDLYPRDAAYRKTITMARHGFGRGEYRYYAHPLPPLVAALRGALYPPLAGIANRWNAALRIDVRYPPQHADFLRRCHEAGQCRPTPLILRYGPGDHNCLHQDLYGPEVFPLQVAVLLSAPGRDHTGGEFVMTERIGHSATRAEVVPLAQQGDAVVFAVHHRPVPGARGARRAELRHGVSALHTGRRHALGIIFHDAS